MGYFCLVIFPVWCYARSLMKNSTAVLIPSIRGGPQHEHMAPKIIAHLKNNNCERQPDKFGRLNAEFYRNWVR